MESTKLQPEMELDSDETADYWLTALFEDDTMVPSRDVTMKDDSPLSRKRQRDVPSHEHHGDLLLSDSTRLLDRPQIADVGGVESSVDMKQDLADTKKEIEKKDPENRNNNDRVAGSSIGGFNFRVRQPTWLRRARRASSSHSASNPRHHGQDTNLFRAPSHLQGPVSLKQPVTRSSENSHVLGHVGVPMQPGESISSAVSSTAPNSGHHVAQANVNMTSSSSPSASSHIQESTSIGQRATSIAGGSTSHAFGSSTQQGALGFGSSISNPGQLTQTNSYQSSSSVPSHLRGPVSLRNKSTTTSSASVPETYHEPDDSRFTKSKGDMSDVSQLLADRIRFCQSVELEIFLSCKGFEQPVFKAKPFVDSPAHERFVNQWEGLAVDSKVSIVFHGTCTRNISNILKYGLDPRRRRGQAYGPGEYFARDPGTSISYCKGGLEILVFLVVEPLTRDPRCPWDYVVVENNSHQLPLGSFTFQGVDREVMISSSRKRNQLAQLSMIAEKKTREANYMMYKAEIIQLLIGEKVDVASEKFQKHASGFCETSKREIAMYAYRLVDEELVPFYFPDLPEPMKTEERDVATIKSVEQAENEAVLAKKAFEDAKKMGANDTHRPAVV